MKIGDTVHYVAGRTHTQCGQVVSFDEETACVVVTHTTWDENDVAHDHQTLAFVERSKIHPTWEDAHRASIE